MDLTEHGRDPTRVEEVTMDMSPAFIKGVTEQCPQAEITFDKFHVMEMIRRRSWHLRIVKQHV